MSFLATTRPDLCHRLMTHPGILVANEDLGVDPETGLLPTVCSAFPADNAEELNRNLEWVVSNVCYRADDALEKGGCLILERLPYVRGATGIVAEAKYIPIVYGLPEDDWAEWSLGLVHQQNLARDNAPKRQPKDSIYA
jgi:hypothetical protein